MRFKGTKNSALWGKGDGRARRALLATVSLVALASSGGVFSLLDLGWLANWTW